MPSVLIVDDAGHIRELVKLYFTAAGFDVSEAADGTTGLRAALEDAPDIVLLDIMLPGLDGAEVCSRIRESSQVPIIMLTSKDAEIDKVALLEAGADDYVVKPFSPAELVARVRAALRRNAPVVVDSLSSTTPVELDGLRIDPARREVRVDDHVVELTAKEFDLLVTMAADPGIVFERERLLERAWGFAEYVDPRGIDVHIRHLREKLGDDATAPRFIETVRGVGYRVRKDAS